MNKTFDKPITIQKIDENEEWLNWYSVHASINKAKTDDEYLSGGAVQAKKNLTFEIRYFKQLEDISFNLQSYRIIYLGKPFDITDFDDFMLQHKTVKLLGVSYE